MVLCIPGILLITASTKIIYKSIEDRLATTKKLPSENGFIIISTIQTLVLIAIAAAFGIDVSNKTNLHAPFFEAIANHQNAWPALRFQILPAIIMGSIGTVVFLCVYYLLVRPRLDKFTVRCIDNLRISVGFWGRVFYGGIIEEVLCRWGLMNLVVWLEMLVFENKNSLTMWSAIFISGIIFGIGHLPAYLSVGCKKTPLFIFSILGLNLWPAIIFGWLFWHYGLCAAIIAHALFHIVWYPFDLHFNRKSLLMGQYGTT